MLGFRILFLNECEPLPGSAKGCVDFAALAARQYRLVVVGQGQLILAKVLMAVA